MGVVTAAVVALFAVAGAVHRLTGMGFALVVVPPLVLLFGPDSGVTLAAFGALLASLSVGLGARRDTDHSAAGILVLTVLAGSVIGVVVAVVTPATWLTIAIGVLTLLAVIASAVVRLRRPATSSSTHPRTLAAAGVVSGVMNATSSIGGPPLSVVASWMGMPHSVFVSTVQVPFVVMGVFTVAGRSFALGIPDVPWWLWPLMVAAVLIGVVAGAWIASRVPEKPAWIATLAIAAAGAVALVVSG
ncbi:sulfite exporter TauE/SafE family protein [Microbacterium alcoholitolerans]|uniref:sulfite exporter TauE/SafE family protein n=1 Tax=unclassified Microbacterium TaxID=2609290 RepID=UPI003D184024